MWIQPLGIKEASAAAVIHSHGSMHGGEVLALAPLHNPAVSSALLRGSEDLAQPCSPTPSALVPLYPLGWASTKGGTSYTARSSLSPCPSGPSCQQTSREGETPSQSSPSLRDLRELCSLAGPWSLAWVLSPHTLPGGAKQLPNGHGVPPRDRDPPCSHSFRGPGLRTQRSNLPTSCSKTMQPMEAACGGE